VNLLGKVSVFPVLPQRLAGLRELAHNMWWSWNPEAQDLFTRLDLALWNKVYHNPVKFLSEIDQQKLDTAAADAGYTKAYDDVMARFGAYVNQKSTWFKDTYGEYAGKTIAYFSAEFGLHEALPIYSGGLGILSGDHCKSASNLDLPFVAVGLLYNQGYFRQQLRPDGMQEAQYDKLNFSELPIQPATTPDGNEVVVDVELPGRTVFAKVWKVSVGRIPVYLLDTDIDRNTPEDRRFSAQLYGGDQDMRISQEIILGIGGVRALRALGVSPSAWHMNEGHSAFLGLERIRELVQYNGVILFEALEAVDGSTIFTTHTPVPSGYDAFAFQLME
jgi:starch phosphorylase